MSSILHTAAAMFISALFLCSLPLPTNAQSPRMVTIRIIFFSVDKDDSFPDSVIMKSGEFDATLSRLKAAKKLRVYAERSGRIKLGETFTHTESGPGQFDREIIEIATFDYGDTGKVCGYEGVAQKTMNDWVPAGKKKIPAFFTMSSTYSAHVAIGSAVIHGAPPGSPSFLTKEQKRPQYFYIALIID